MFVENLDKVTEFVNRNKVKAKKGFICVDGRYPKGKYSGMMARPGGNFRGILVLLALRSKLGVTVGKLVDNIIEAVEEMGISFNMHTDHHFKGASDLEGIGCGHIAKAAHNETANQYHVKALDVHKALIYLRIKLEGRKYYHLAELNGAHKEKGVLVITGKNYTVNHWDQDKDEMYFVFDKARDEEYQKKLFEAFKKRFPKLNYQEFIKYSELQLNATLHNLAKGLSIYEVNLDKKAPEVKFAGCV